MATAKILLSASFCLALPCWAGGVQTLETVEVWASAENLIGLADSATQGTVTAKQLESRPLLRPGELLETVPGLIVTQHSGDGKANQYFLRGFNLDHGTDLSVHLDGMPLNMPTHGHGQGYADMNFLIPELVDNIQYRKGPYAAEDGDFSAAGAAHIRYSDNLKHGIAELSLGSWNYKRALLADSTAMTGGTLLYAAELFRNDGPWQNPEDFAKLNTVLRYSRGTNRDGFSLTAMAYQADWNATDQIPQRLVSSGALDRFGAIDPSDGGKTCRYSLSGDWRTADSVGDTSLSAYVISSKLNLHSNFTYFLNDTVNGDQFEQEDNRVISGLSAAHKHYAKLAGMDAEHTVGLQVRNDNILNVGLYNSIARQRTSTTRADSVVQTSVSPYYQAALQISELFRLVGGARGDLYRFNVKSDNPLNSGEEADSMISPKLSLIFGPWEQTEYYFNYGYGFHSNDARGATINVDPATLTPAERVNPLVRAKGSEVGVRSILLPGWQTALALWRLNIGSELLFTGDAGTTEASRPSRRQGIEWSNFYKPNDWLTADADLALSSARFTDEDPAGNQIPGAIEQTLSAGLTAEGYGAWVFGARLRYFGPRPLIEDGSVMSASSSLVNVKIGYKFERDLRLSLDIYNLFNRQVSDIDYYYQSRLPGEGAAGAWDVHSHPAEPISLRLTLTANF